MLKIDPERFLEQRGVKLTANRISVLRALAGQSRPVSIADLEECLHPMDKASIFRVLELFAEKEVVHCIDDGSRSVKYELCSADRHGISDQHVHFHCEKCGTTYCFDDLKVPTVSVPMGFIPRSINYVLKGLCPDCSSEAYGE